MKALGIQETCPDCGVRIGEQHNRGCTIDRCPFCGIQMLQDECCYTYFSINVATIEQEYPDIYENGLSLEMQESYEKYLHSHRLRWDGVRYGVMECREYNLWCKWTANGWQTCSANDPDATEDLNELAIRTYWHQGKKRFVMRAE